MCVKLLTPYRSCDARASDLGRLLDEHFDTFQQVYHKHFQGQYGFWQPFVNGPVSAFLKCGDLVEGFAPVRCVDCHHEMCVAKSIQEAFVTNQYTTTSLQFIDNIC